MLSKKLKKVGKKLILNMKIYRMLMLNVSFLLEFDSVTLINKKYIATQLISCGIALALTYTVVG